MLKVRLMGTKNDIKWFVRRKQVLEKIRSDREVKIENLQEVKDENI